MKKLNNTAFWIGIFALIVVSVSCESLLEEETFSFVDKKSFYQNEDDANAALTGAYGRLQSSGGFSESYLRVLALSSGGFSHNISVGPTSPLLMKNYTSADQYIGSLWGNAYEVVSQCNDIILYVPQSEIDSTVSKSVEGQARFLRAMEYFNLVRMFGAVPLVTRPVESLDSIYAERSGEELVYDLIINDLEEGIELMSETSELTGQANANTARALLAKVYLTLGSMKLNEENPEKHYTFVSSSASYFQKCLDVATEIEGLYSLESDFGDLWALNSEFTAESIFEIQFVNGFPGSGTLLPQLTTGSNQGYSFNDSGWGFILPSKMAYDDFLSAHTGDYRIDKSFLGGSTGLIPVLRSGVAIKSNVNYPADSLLNCYKGNGIRGSIPNIPGSGSRQWNGWSYLAKYIDPFATSTNEHSSNFIYLRYADVLLMMAEAENELNGPVNAYQYVNQVMERARQADGSARTIPYDFDDPNRAIQPTTKEIFREEIWKERRYELLGEGHLWFDLIRTGNLISYIEAHNSHPYNDAVYDITMQTDNRLFLFPIPEAEIIQNRNISSTDQNPGY